MTIKTIRVKNFKSFKELSVDLGKFNILIGANASGKSNFIRIFEFLRDIARHGLENAISLQGGAEYVTNLNLGTAENLVMQVVSEQGRGGHHIGTSEADGTALFALPLEAAYSFSIGFPKRAGEFKVLDDRTSRVRDFVTRTPAPFTWPSSPLWLGLGTEPKKGALVHSKWGCF